MHPFYINKLEVKLLILRIFIVLFAFSICFANADISWSKKKGSGSEYEDVFMPQLTGTFVKIDGDDVYPREPNISKTRFLKYPPVTSLSERVDRLVYGITTDVRPELDHYGYEIRRYMSHVGNIKVFDDNEFLNNQIMNARKAKIIADYWEKHIEQEISEIGKILEDDSSIALRVRTVFKQNKIVCHIFIISLKSWIDANERLLTHIHKEPDIYKVMYPEVNVVIPSSRIDFYNLYVIRQTRLKDINKYQSFALMVY